MNQAVLCLLGLTAGMLVMCSSEPLEKRQPHNWEEVFAPTTPNPGSSEMNPDGSKKPESSNESPESPVLNQAKDTKKVCFEECRKLEKPGLTAACEADENVVGCAASGVGGCTVSQTFDARGCAVNKNSCVDDFVMAPWTNPIVNAVCCKQNAVRVQ